MTIEISLLLSGVSVAFAIFFGICSKQRNEKKDTQEDAEQRATTDTMVMVKLENIADDLKDIKRESRENSEEMKTLRDRVIIVEQSLKSYHKRLDGEQHSDRKQEGRKRARINLTEKRQYMRMTEQERRIRIRHLKRMYRIRERKERHDKKVSGLFMKRVVFTLILAAFIYTVVAIIVFVRVGAEPSTLTENVFRFLSVEGGAMALIKSVKTVTKKDTGKQHENEPDDINADNNEEVQG